MDEWKELKRDSSFKRLVNRVESSIACRREYHWFVKNKTCVVCEHFSWFMCSAGVCRAKDGCASSRMKDCMDTCDCGNFKKYKRSKNGR